jgi:hypothetical protein
MTVLHMRAVLGQFGLGLVKGWTGSGKKFVCSSRPYRLCIAAGT